MKKLLTTLMLLAMLAMSVTLRAQSLYEYAFLTGTDANKWIPLTTTTSVILETGDSKASAVLSIGFTFPFGDTTYTQYSVNSDGNLRLGSTVTGTSAYTTPFNTTNANNNNPKINALGCDGFYTDSSYVYAENTVDANGDSLLVVEFCEQTFATNSRNAKLKWQIHLYPSGNIVMVYHSVAPTILPDVARQVGLCVDKTDGYTISASHVATHFTNGTTATIPAGNWPNLNRYYTFVRSTSSSCLKPNINDITATESTITFSWSERNAAQQWYVKIADSTGFCTPIAVTDSTYTFTGLESYTTYTIAVASACSATDTSFWVAAEFKTTCSPHTIPYTYGFEDATGSGAVHSISPCWQRITNGTTAYPYPSTTYSHYGNHALYFYNTANGATYSYAVLPMFSEAVSNLQLTFWGYKTTANNGHIIVGVMSNPTDLSTFDTIAAFQVQNLSSWEYFEVPFGSYTGSGRYIVFLSSATAANNIYIDDITVDYMPTCPRPTNLVVSNNTTTTVDLTWTENGSASQWLIEYGSTDFLPGQGTQEIANTNTGFTLTNLLPSNHYDVHIHALCSNGDTSTVLYGHFTTNCSELDLPYTYGFENDATGTSAQFPYCWNRINDATSTSYNYYPYVNSSTSNAHRGTNYLYFAQSTSATYANNEYAVLPAINTDNYPMAGNELIFWAKVTSTLEGELIVGVMTDPTNASTFAAVDTITVVTGGYNMYTVNFADYADTGKYIAIRARRLNSTIYTYVDDIIVRQASLCPTVTNAEVVTIGIDEAVLSWSSNELHGTYTVTYGTAGFAADTAVSETVTDTTVTLMSLLPSTDYEFFITANCPSFGESNATIRYSFRTACEPIASSELPYFEGFEGYSTGASAAINPCWVKGTNNTTAYPYPYSTAATGSRGLYFYSNNSATIYCYAALPLFEDDLSNLRLRFNLKRHGTASYGSCLIVGVMSNTNDINTFEALDTLDLTAEPTNSVHPFEYFMDSYTGEGRYIAFRTATAPAGTTTNYITLDDVTIDLIPECRRSTNLSATNVLDHEATLSWENGSSSVNSYVVALSTTNGFNPDTCTNTFTTTTNSLNLTGLNDYTHYYWTVRADCGSDSSEWAFQSNFTTLTDCGANGINIIDTIGHGTSASATYTMYPSTSYPTAYSRNIFTVEELAQMGLQTNNRINGISIHCGSTGGTIPNVKIYLTETNLNEFGNPAANDTIAPADMTLVYQGDITAIANQWVEIIFDSAFHYSGNSNLMTCLSRSGTCSAAAYFYYTSTTPRYSTCYGYRSSTTTVNNTCIRVYTRTNMVFNICTDIPNCPRPTDVAMTAISDTSASFAWDGITATQFEIACNAAGFNPDTATNTIVVNDTAACTLLNLAQNTVYDMYVRALCGTDHSDWSLAYNFRTACSPMAIPYSEDFEAYGTGSTQAISPCWTKGTSSTTAYPYPYSSNAINGTRSLYFYGYRSGDITTYYSYAALPLMDAPLDTLVLTFNMRCHSNTTDVYTSRIVVGVMSDPNDINTFTPVDTIDMRNEDALSVRGVEVSFEHYTGNGKYIALYDGDLPLYSGTSNTYSYVYIDDILVNYRAACISPADLSVADSTITPSSVVLTWADRANAAGYEIEYGPMGFTPGTGTLINSTTNPTTLTGLNHSSNYDVYVRALCSGNEYSDWSFVYHFQTACAPTNVLPVTYTFEDAASGQNMPYPTCWTRANDATGTTDTYTKVPYVYNSTSYAHSGSKCLYFNVSSTTSNYASTITTAMPEIDTTLYPANTIEVVFWGRGSTATTDGSIMVGMMTDPNDLSTFTAVDTIQLTTTLAEYTVPFTNYTGYGSYPAFQKVRTGSTAGYAYIDDVTIEQVPPCGRPIELEATASTATSATLAWVDTVDATQWMIEYSILGDTVVNTVIANANPFTLTGLTPASYYTYRVASYCPASSMLSSFSRNYCNFATSQIPATLPYYYNFEDAAEWSNWQTLSNQPTNWFRGTAGDSTNANNYTMYISSDNGATVSTNMNQIVNACAYRDIDFGTTDGSFTITFNANVGGTTPNNYDGVSILLVDPSTYVEPSNTGIVSPWGHVNDISLGTVRRSGGWDTYTYYFDNITGVKRVVFYWFNQSTGTTNFVGDPAVIDSIVVEAQPCARPYDLQTIHRTETEATLTWGGDINGNYAVIYRESDAPASSNATAYTATNSITLTGLNAHTEYIYWVRHICDSTLLSDYSTNGFFTTACSIYSATDTLYEDFHTTPGVAYNAAGELPICWEGYSNGTSDLYIPHVVNSGSYWYTASDSSAIIMTSGSDTYGNTKIVRLPMFAESVNTLTLSYWMCTESSSLGTFSVGYLTGDNYETDFVSIRDISASSATLHSGSGYQPTAGIYDTVSFENAPDNAQYIAFKWYHTSLFYSVAVDNVKVTSSNPCAKPIVSSTTNDYANITLNWTGSGSNYEVAIKESSIGAWNEAIATTETSYTFTNLTPATSYDLQVRQDCTADEAGYSEWTLVTVVTDSLPCFTPEALSVVATNYTSATLGWTANSETEWVLHVWRSDVNFYDTVSTNPATVNGLYSGMTYSAAVAARCGNGAAYSDWSDTITFTTEICQPVTNVQVSNVTNNSAQVSWTSPAGATAWQVNYGGMDFPQGQGTIYDVTATPYTINGLESETYYDVYVRNSCTADLFSDWSNKVTFLTEGVGISSIDANSQVSIYPNPTNGVATITWSNNEAMWNVEVVDLQGRPVSKQSNIHGTTLQMNTLPAGTYFVRIYSDSVSTVKKLIVR